MIEAEAELFRADVEIIASEDWSTLYDADPVTLAKLIRTEANMLRKLRRYFKDMSSDVAQHIKWQNYDSIVYERSLKAVQAAEGDVEVQVIVEDVPIEDYDGTFLTIIFDEIATAAALGAQSGEEIYSRYLGMDSSNAVIQRYARSKSASLVGKKLDKNGNIVDNPKATYRINDKTRTDIRESIRTSINIGETQEQARDRLLSVVKNPKRAELIAQTEAVNSFQGGLLTFGAQSGAVGKESQALNTGDRCKVYEAEGMVPLDYLYDGRYEGPAYHPRCRCGLRLVYQEELNK